MPFLHFLLTRLLFLGSFALLTSCHNNDPTTGTTQVAGQVVESQSQKPVGKGTVQVYLAKYGGGYSPLGNAYPCDANGRFAFDFEGQAKESYILKAQAPPGYFTDWAVAPYLTPGRKNQNLIVPVLAPAWVRLVLVDEPPKSKVSMHISGYEGNGDELNPVQDTTLIRPSLAGFTWKLIWIVRDVNGTKTQHEQVINLAPLDTLSVHIPF